MTFYRCYAFIVVAVLAVRAIAAEEADFDKIANCEKSAVAGELIREAFSSASREQLREWKFSKYAGIALRAAWQEAVLASIDESGPLPRAISHAAAQRFVGFVEGRLDVAVPKSWEAIVSNGYLRQSGLATFSDPARIEYVNRLGQISTPAGTELLKDEGFISLVTGDVRSRVRNSILQTSAEQQVKRLAWLAEAGGCFVAVYPDLGSDYDLMHIGGDGERVDWRVDVWGTQPPFTFGLSGHRVEILHRSGDVLVFGGGSFGVYIEAFRAEDGKNLFRFCTYDWGREYPRGD